MTEVLNSFWDKFQSCCFAGEEQSMLFSTFSSLHWPSEVISFFLISWPCIDDHALLSAQSSKSTCRFPTNSQSTLQIRCDFPFGGKRATFKRGDWFSARPESRWAPLWLSPITPSSPPSQPRTLWLCFRGWQDHLRHLSYKPRYWTPNLQ